MNHRLPLLTLAGLLALSPTDKATKPDFDQGLREAPVEELPERTPVAKLIELHRAETRPSRILIPQLIQDDDEKLANLIALSQISNSNIVSYEKLIDPLLLKAQNWDKVLKKAAYSLVTNLLAKTCQTIFPITNANGPAVYNVEAAIREQLKEPHIQAYVDSLPKTEQLAKDLDAIRKTALLASLGNSGNAS